MKVLTFPRKPLHGWIGGGSGGSSGERSGLPPVCSVSPIISTSLQQNIQSDLEPSILLIIKVWEDVFCQSLRKSAYKSFLIRVNDR